MSDPPRDLGRMLVTVLVIGALLLCSAWIIRPFLPATIWAVTIVVATWPLLRRIESLLWRSRTLAVLVTASVVLLVFVVPVWLALSTILDRADQLIGLASSAARFHLPPVPGWVHRLPLIGPHLADTLNTIDEAGPAQLARNLAPYAGEATRYFIGLAGSFGMLVVQFLLTVVIAAIIHARGEAAAGFVLRLAERIGGRRGRQVALLAGNSIRAVAIGVMVTALAESAVAGLGMYFAGVPLAPVLTAVTFVFCVAQAGPGVVLVPAVIWMYLFSNPGRATLLLAALLVAVAIDVGVRPYLIRREAELPTLLVLAGVIGGLAAFGVIGIFIGPTVLAVTYTLMQAWLNDPVP